MSHIYQPLIIRRLLLDGGKATNKQVAEDMAVNDPSMQEYYESIAWGMPRPVLSRRGVISTQGRGTSREWLLNVSPLPQGATKEELVRLCDEKIQEFFQQRGKAVWDHRRRGRRPVSGTVRYEVLKRAQGRCELCGVHGDNRGLEVDHINPKARGGKDDLVNYQALCYVCNATKRDRDTTDFRGMRGRGIRVGSREATCVLCGRMEEAKAENDWAVAVEDRYPVTPGHILVIPRVHVPGLQDLSPEQVNGCMALVLHIQKRGRAQGIRAFNVGVNDGQEAGQTILHVHIHVIPRRKGDVPDPIGGIRGVIPGKANYHVF